MQVQVVDAGGFLAGLSRKDLLRLRQVVRVVHFGRFPRSVITDRECDRLIDALGPRVLEHQLKWLIDARVVE